MTNKNDQLIIDKVLRGNVNAFASLVNTYKDMVFSLAFKMIKNREEAEEVSQDTFIKAYKNLKNFKGDSKFSTWLYSIAYYTILDNIKKNKKNTFTFELNEINLHQLKTVETILEGIDRKERSEIIEACLLKMNEEERAIIWMFYYDELTLKEIMTVTKLAEANVKVKLHRARKKLLKIVKENVSPEIIENYGRK